MKRLSLKLSPIKVPSTTDLVSLKSSSRTSLKSSSRTRLSSPSLPSLSERRILPAEVEAELRAACAELVLSHTDLRVADPGLRQDLELEALNRALREKRKEKLGQTAEDPRRISRDRVSTHAHHAPTLKGRGHAQEPRARDSHRDSKLSAVDAKADSRQRHSRPVSGPAGGLDAPARSSSSRTHLDQPDSAGVVQPSSGRRYVDSFSSADSIALTNSTDRRPHTASTTLTSVMISPVSNRNSRPVEEPTLFHNDRTAVDWYRDEYPQRRNESFDEERGRPPSRATIRSIKDEISNYIRPRSGSLKRPSSRDSMRSNSSSAGPARSNSSHGWRSWSLQRKGSSGSIRSNFSFKGQSTAEGEAKKAELNLNRELPPLPSLDTWQNEQSAATTHISRLIRGHDAKQTQALSDIHKQSQHFSESVGITALPQMPVKSPTSSEFSRNKKKSHRRSWTDGAVKIENIHSASPRHRKDGEGAFDYADPAATSRQPPAREHIAQSAHTTGRSVDVIQKAIQMRTVVENYHQPPSSRPTTQPAQQKPKSRHGKARPLSEARSLQQHHHHQQHTPPPPLPPPPQQQQGKDAQPRKEQKEKTARGLRRVFSAWLVGKRDAKHARDQHQQHWDPRLGADAEKAAAAAAAAYGAGSGRAVHAG